MVVGGRIVSHDYKGHVPCDLAIGFGIQSTRPLK